MKQYTSCGEYVSVETIDNTYHDVIICPRSDDKRVHLLEYSNGAVILIYTDSIVSIKRERHDKHVIG